MKYKAVSKECIREGCKRERRKGGRLCKECHAAHMRDSRKKRSSACPEEMVREALERAVKHGRRGHLPPELEEKIRVAAARAAAEIEQFNHGVGGERVA